MLNTAFKQKASDELNLRLSVGLNTGVPFCFLGMALSNMPGDLAIALSCSLAGFIAYTLVEYQVHRWILHGLALSGHQDHHRAPAEPTAMPFSTGLTAHTLLLVLLSLWLGLDVAIWTVFGTALGYALFCQLHEIEHRDAGLAHRLWPRLHRHHMLHHEPAHGSMGMRDPACNFGVLTTSWDRLFGTYRS